MNEINYAQTNLQLYNQLIRLGYKEPDLRLIRNAYKLAMELFAGQFRPNEKPFLAHLVGTASILASLEEPSSVLAAGLLHSVYTHGEFGDGSRGITREKRAFICKAVGSEIENLAANYTDDIWNINPPPAIQKKLPSSASKDRSILIIGLANMLEEFSDNGMAYCKKKKFQFQSNDLARLRQTAVEAAESLGHTSLAAALDQLLKEHSSFIPPQGLNTERNMSFTLAPKSYRKTVRVKLTRLADKWFQTLSK